MEPYVHDAVLDMLHARDELEKVLDSVGADDWERYVPYGERTLHDLLAHIAGADQVWAVAAQGLLRGEAEEVPARTPAEARAARERAVARGRTRSVAELRAEMAQRRKLLVGLLGLLEPRHLALRLPAFGEHHNSVRERIWLGYHDRLHADDVRRALRMSWYPQSLRFIPDIRPVVDALDPGETLYVVYNVDPEYWERPSTVPGWMYRTVLAHIATGDWVLQGHLRHIIDTGKVGPWPDIDTGNERLTEERRVSAVGALIEEFLSMRHETLRLLSRLQPRHLSLIIEFWWEEQPNRHTVLEYLEGFYMHDRTHREQLRPAMKYLTSKYV